MATKIAAADLPHVGTDRQGHKWTPAMELRSRLNMVIRVLNAANTLHQVNLLTTAEFDSMCENINQRVTIDL